MKICVMGCLLFAVVWTKAAVVSITLTDETGEPVSDARVRVGFADYRGDGRTVQGLSGKQGKYQARGSPNHSIRIWVSKEDHYSAELEKLNPSIDHNLEVVLPRVRNPRPLFTNIKSVEQKFPQLPKFNTWIGFDLEKADWVAPYGEGSTIDFNINITKKFVGFNLTERDLKTIRERYPEFSEDEFRFYWGIWETSLQLTFPEPRSGIFESLEYIDYSEMPMPHQAPGDVYRSEWKWNHNTKTKLEGRDAGKGYFMKTRLEIDDEGNEISANYSKFLGTPWFNISGTIKWEYYFNPDPNDRNLEYNGTNLAETRK